MTKFTTLLATTLLASSTIAFTANASDDWGWDDTEVWVGDYKSNTQMVVRDSRVDQIVADPTKVKLYETNDVREVKLVINPSKKKGGKDKLGRIQNQDLAIDFGSKQPIEIIRKDGTKITYMIDITNPLVAQYTVLATLNDADLKDALINEAGKSKSARIADVLSLDAQTDILNKRAHTQSIARQEMELQLNSIIAQQEAIKEAYKTRKAMIATDAEYTAALIKTDAENRKKLDDLSAELEVLRSNFDSSKPLLVEAVATVATKEEAKAPVSYAPINRIALNDEAMGFKFATRSIITADNLNAIESMQKDLAKKDIEANKPLAAKIEAAAAAFRYNFKSHVWAVYDAAVEEARNPKAVEAVATETPSSEVTTTPAGENK